MKPSWQIEYYKNKRGDEIVREFIDGLPVETRIKVRGTLKLLEEYGILIEAPHTKKIIGTSLWELRTLGESSVRIFYIAKINRTFWLLHGFIKKSQKTPESEIKTALKRLRELN